MIRRAGARAWAEAQVAAVEDDPAGRLELLERTYRGPAERARRHLPFRRAAVFVMQWHDPLESPRPGSAWWRAVNERLLRDGCEAVALVGDRPGTPSEPAVGLGLEFIAEPTGRNW